MTPKASFFLAILNGCTVVLNRHLLGITLGLPQREVVAQELHDESGVLVLLFCQAFEFADLYGAGGTMGIYK